MARALQQDLKTAHNQVFVVNARYANILLQEIY